MPNLTSSLHRRPPNYASSGLAPPLEALLASFWLALRAEGITEKALAI